MFGQYASNLGHAFVWARDIIPHVQIHRRYPSQFVFRTTKSSQPPGVVQGGCYRVSDELVAALVEVQAVLEYELLEPL